MHYSCNIHKPDYYYLDPKFTLYDIYPHNMLPHHFTLYVLCPPQHAPSPFLLVRPIPPQHRPLTTFDLVQPLSQQHRPLTIWPCTTSIPTTLTPHHPWPPPLVASMSDDLHRLITAATSQPKPYIIVASEMSTLVARFYAQLYQKFVKSNHINYLRSFILYILFGFYPSILLCNIQ